MGGWEIRGGHLHRGQHGDRTNGSLPSVSLCGDEEMLKRAESGQ